MANCVILPQAEIDKLLNIVGYGIVVLVAEETMTALGLSDEEVVSHAEDYACGNEADLWVDMADHKDHFFFQSLLEKREEKLSEGEGITGEAVPGDR